jgi:hypothetical protein
MEECGLTTSRIFSWSEGLSVCVMIEEAMSDYEEEKK